MDIDKFKAIVFDLDGVLTSTAHLHGQAWKQVFEERGESFDVRRDYPLYVDGRPRHDGVKSFYKSRNQTPDKETVQKIGDRKNEIFHDLLRTKGASAFPGVPEQLQRWRLYGLKLAVVSSSKNGSLVLRQSGLKPYFDLILDGNDLEDRKIPGKPSPEMFLAAARELHVPPEQAVVFEDSLAGVKAGRAGGFGLVVGIQRNSSPRSLKEEGADYVLSGITELDRALADPSSLGPKPALECLDEIRKDIASKPFAFFLDYDGTLTPIVKHPSEAILPSEMRETLKSLAQHFSVTVISGRDRTDVENLVGIKGINYVGSHGFDTKLADGTLNSLDEAKGVQIDIERASKELHDHLQAIDGVLIEKKSFSVAVHYRNVNAKDLPQLNKITDDISGKYKNLIKTGGKKVIDFRPNLDWHKGKALLWICDKLKQGSKEPYPIYLGDDLTDEDAFEVIRGRGIGILVGKPTFPSCARYFLIDQDEVKMFLWFLINGTLNNSLLERPYAP